MSNLRQEMADILKKTTTRPDHAKLDSILTPINEIEDMEVRDVIASALKGNLNSILLGLVLNASFTQEKLSFLYSKRILEEIVNAAATMEIIHRHTISGKDYKDFMAFARNNNAMVPLILGNKNEASVFKISIKSFCNVMYLKGGISYYDEQEKTVLAIHKKFSEAFTPTSQQLPSETSQQTSHDIMNNEIVTNDSYIHTTAEVDGIFRDLKNKILSPANEYKVKDMFGIHVKGVMLSKASIEALKKILSRENYQLSVKEMVKKFNLPESVPAPTVEVGNLVGYYPCVINGKLGIATSSGFIPALKFKPGVVKRNAFIAPKDDLIPWTVEQLNTLPNLPLTEAQVDDFIEHNNIDGASELNYADNENK